MAANAGIGVKGWRNYSTFALFAGGSQRADRQTSLLVDTLSGNFSVLATDWLLAARIPCALARSYNHQDTTAGVDRPFGPGWSWQYDMLLTGNMTGSGNVMWKAADGSEYDFVYSAGPPASWASPAGMHDYTLTFASGPTPDRYILSVGKMNYVFEVNTTDGVARLIRIEDLNGNALNIVRVYSSSKPTWEIDKLQIEYDNSGPTTHDIVDVTYRSTTQLIERLTLLDTLDGGDYLEVFYDYATIDSELRLTHVEPQFGGVNIDMEVEYGYDASAGLELTSVADTLGIAGSYAWAVSYTTGQVDSVTFPIDGLPTTGTVAYAYDQSLPSGWPGPAGPPTRLTVVTDARSNDWLYQHDSAGRVLYSADPLWADTTHESEVAYAYNADNQVTSVDTPAPNADATRLQTLYFYNANKKLEVVQDAYGFLSFYQYGTRTPYGGGGTGATTNDVIGIFTPMPNQQAYDDADHTISATVAPASPDITDVNWNNGSGFYYYTDASTSPKTIKLVRSVMDYEYTTGTGQLEKLRSCSPANFAETPANPPVFTLTTASGASEQRFNAATGDLERSYIPSQFQSGSTGYTAYTHDAVYGVVTDVEAADSVLAVAGKVTHTEYNVLRTRVVQVQRPEDNANQWTTTAYDAIDLSVAYSLSDIAKVKGPMYATKTVRPDIGSWSIEPITSVTEYDDNGNVTQQWQADPGGTPADWDGDTGSGGYEQVAGQAYDRLNRLVESTLYVNWEQNVLPTPPSAPQVSQSYYDKNGNRTVARGPEYDAGGAVYDWTYATYDAANRLERAYNAFADASATPPGATGPYSENLYDLAGNVVEARQPLYTGGSYYKTLTTYDWLNRGIATTGYYDMSATPTPRSTQQHFTASGGVYWSMDGEGGEMWPEADLNGRLLKMFRGSLGGDNYERTYDVDGHVLYVYSYQDIDDGIYRMRHAYDNIGRLVNSGREEKVLGVWTNWNANTAAAEFNWNGAVTKSYDKVNSGKYTERLYDDWGQNYQTAAPEVDYLGTPTVFTLDYTFDVLGRRTTSSDYNGNATTYKLDLLGRTINVNDAENYDTATYFDARGLLWKTVTPRMAEYARTYDARGLLTELAVDHDMTVDTTTYLYDDNGRQYQMDLPNGGQTLTGYDELGRKILVQSLHSGSDYLDTAYTYDLNDQVLTLTLPGGYTTTNTYYPVVNTLHTVTDPATDVTTYSYDLDNRKLTTIQPNGLTTTLTYDWRTGGTNSITQNRSASSGDDIVMLYAFDNNGQTILVTDGNIQDWVKAHDAMGRLISLETPDPGGGTFTQTIYPDGNGNKVQTNDFAGVDHYYAYDGLNRMTAHGTASPPVDEKYYWNCCNELSGYDDAISTGTATLTYDDLGRLMSHIDSAGSEVQYTYDPLGRVLTVVPPQGASYQTEYAYNLNGSLATATVYDSGMGHATDYSYDLVVTGSGLLLQRDMPVRSGSHIRTAYGYDGAGRLTQETVTNEAGGPTNLYRTGYAYTWLTYGNQVERTEQSWVTGHGPPQWGTDAVIQYQHNTLKWQVSENRVEGANTRYTTTQEYDANGNRTRYNKSVQGGQTGTYGQSVDITTGYDAMNRPTTASDANNANWASTFTCDENSNITLIDETQTNGTGTTHLYSYFDMDGLNRMQANRVKFWDTGVAKWTKRAHLYSATGAILQSTYKAWNDGSMEPAGDSLLHSWNQNGSHVQNTDTGGTTYGQHWHWAGAMNAHAAPLAGPNADTAAQNGYNIAVAGGSGTPNRRSFLTPTSEGDKRNIWGQGRPNAKDNNAAWAPGKLSTQTGLSGLPNMESVYEFNGTVAPTDLDRATDAREKGRIGIVGSGYSYYGSSPRVTSETIGRDINPLGRGDGNAYVGGWLNLGRIAPRLPMSKSKPGMGASVNNDSSPIDVPPCGCYYTLCRHPLISGPGGCPCDDVYQTFNDRCHGNCCGHECHELFCNFLHCLPDCKYNPPCNGLRDPEGTLAANNCDGPNCPSGGGGGGCTSCGGGYTKSAPCTTCNSSLLMMPGRGFRGDAILKSYPAPKVPPGTFTCGWDAIFAAFQIVIDNSSHPCWCLLDPDYKTCLLSGLKYVINNGKYIVCQSKDDIPPGYQWDTSPCGDCSNPGLLGRQQGGVIVLCCNNIPYRNTSEGSILCDVMETLLHELIHAGNLTENLAKCTHADGETYGFPDLFPFIQCICRGYTDNIDTWHGKPPIY